MDGETILECRGEFTCTAAPKINRHYLWFGKERIAQINSGKTPDEVYGGIDGWLAFIQKRSAKRIVKINQQIADLSKERSQLAELKNSIQSVQ